MKKKVIAIIGIIAGAFLLFRSMALAIGLDMPLENTVMRYINSDAYNYVIEASLRGGRIAAHATYLAGGVICIVLSLFKLSECNSIAKTKETAICAQATVAPQQIPMSKEEEALYGSNEAKNL